MKRYYLFLIACCSALGIAPATARAQLPGGAHFVVRMLQGQEVKLPADNVAPFDGNSLRLMLTTAGLDSDYRNENLTATLIGADGSKVEARPDANGIVNFANIKDSGLHALVVTGGKAAYSAMALYLDAAAAKAPAPDAAAAPPAGNLVEHPFEVHLGKVDPNQIRTAVESSGHAPMGSSVRRLTDYPIEPAHGYRVALHADGSLTGRVIVPEAGYERMPGPVQLSFLRNGVTVASTVSDADGHFLVRGLSSGIHTVVASGPPGHTAFAFEIVQPVEELPALTKRSVTGILPVSTQAAAQVPTELIIVLIPPTLMPGVREVVQQAYPTPLMVPGATGAGFGPAMAGGGFGGGGFGGGGMGGGLGAGGGGAGGFGGLGALLGIGGLAAGIVALASNDDGFDTVISSP